MIDEGDVVALLEQTVHALAVLDAPQLMRLERWSLDVERALPRLDDATIRKAREKIAVLKLTLDATAANVRLLRRLRGEGEAQRWVR